MLITHDIHVHTKFSSCCNDEHALLENYITRAKELGITTLGISDHLWEENVEGASEWYKPQGLNRIWETGETIKKINPDIRVLLGAEAEYAKGILSITPESAARLDYVLVPHSHTHMKGFVLPETVNTLEGVANYMVRSFKEITVKGIATVIAHPFQPGGYNNIRDLLQIYSYLPDSTFAECFTLAKKHHTGIEINIGSFFNESPLDDIFKRSYLRMYQIAKDCGCQFSFGSDTHSINKLSRIKLGELIADYLKLTEDDLIDLVK
jgi:histidinol phosphatase-like PHP family hydrolase